MSVYIFKRTSDWFQGRGYAQHTIITSSLNFNTMTSTCKSNLLNEVVQYKTAYVELAFAHSMLRSIDQAKASEGEFHSGGFVLHNFIEPVTFAR